MFRPPSSRVLLLEQILFGFLLFSVLWRGGKGLESVWMLVGVSGVLTIASFFMKGTRQTEGKAEIPAPKVWLSVMAFLFWTMFSYVFSGAANYGLDEVFRDAALVLVFFWTVRRVQQQGGDQFVSRFAVSLAIAAILAVAFGVLVYALQPVNRFVGTFFDYRFHTDYWPNAWAQFLLLAWPMGTLSILNRTKKSQHAGCILLGGLLGALLLSYSRGAMIAFVGQVFLLAAWYVMRRRAVSPEDRRHLLAGQTGMTDGRVLPMIIVVSLIAIGMFFSVNALRGQYHPVQSVTEKITFSADEGSSSVSERAQFWSQSIILIKQKPLLGWGPYSFRFIHQRLQTGVLETSDHPHNLFLKIAVERGLPAGIFFLLLLLCILVPVLQRVVADVRSQNPSLQAAVSLPGQPIEVSSKETFLAVAVLGVLAHNLIDYNLQFVGIALPFWMMLGMLVGGCGKSNVETSKILNKKFVQIFELILAIMLILIALYEGLYLLTSSMGRHAEVRSDDAAALRWYDHSTGEFFSRDMHLSRALLATMRGENNRAQEAITVYLGLNAEDPRGWRLLGDIAKQSGDSTVALDAYGKAYALGRWNDLSITLARVELLIGEKIEGRGQRTEDGSRIALEAMKPEIDALLSAFVDAIVHNAHFIALSHNAEDATLLANLLAHAFPKDAPRYEVLAAKADHAMRMERAKVKSRPAGYLW